MKLSSRLLLLLGLCLAPMVAAQLYLRHDLAELHRAQLGALALGQAEIANGGLAEITTSAAALARAIGTTAMPTAAGRCGGIKRTLAPSLSPYRFAAIYRPDGRLLCAVGANPTAGLADQPAAPWVQAAIAASGVLIGLAQHPEKADGFLPISLHLPPAGGEPARVVVLGLDLNWLRTILSGFDLSETMRAGTGVLFITDRAGTILAAAPSLPGWLTTTPTATLAAMAATSRPGIRDLPGHALAAYMPATVVPEGLMVGAAYSRAPLSAAILAAANRQTLLITAVALLALALILLAAQRYVMRPTERLLAAARRWRQADWTARATQPGPALEFRMLHETFNEMAEALAARERDAADRMEARGRALSTTNDRLHVEIAEREKTEATLLQAQKLQALGQLSGGIAHDFNNLLATILGSLELLERHVGATSVEDRERAATLIKRASDAVERGARLSTRLLAFARRQRLSPRAVQVNRVIVDLLALARGTLGRRIRIETDLAPDLRMAIADPSQLEAAILNLCLNARDAMAQGGTIRIVTENASPGQVRIRVSDTGPGMSEAVRRRAFEPFFTTKGPNGSGLGLSQVQNMARQAGGRVQIHSREGAGTDVTILLSAGPQEEARETPAETAPAPASAPLHVLLVDDDDAVRQVTAEMLRELGCVVREATDGGAALAVLDNAMASIGLLMLDYAMPGMNGLEVARAAKMRGLSVPIAIITGYAEYAERLESEVDVLMRKPFTIADLEGLLRRVHATS